MEAINEKRRTGWVAVILLLLPVAHPFLMPVVGAPSHLLWFSHPVAVGLLTFEFGRPGALWGLGVSVAGVVLGEWFFGGGFGVPADAPTIVALTTAVGVIDLFLAAFALDARFVSRRYRLLYDQARLPMVKVDGEQRILELNREARRLVGLPDGAPSGERLSDILVAPSFEDLRTFAREGSWSGRMEIRLHGGSTRPLHGDLVILPEPDRDGFDVIVTDRSLETNQREELERQAKLASLGEALAGVAHELNNPLAVIVAHAQMGEDSADPAAADAFRVIGEESARMRNLLQELLGYSRRSEAVGTAAIHDVVRRTVRVQAVAAGRAVSVQASVEWEGEVAAQPQHLEQVLLNLVSNAVYAAGRGGEGEVVVRVIGEEPAYVSAEPGMADPCHIVVEVADNGPGIDPGVQDTLFQPFVTTKPEGEGTGLGLAICRRLARGWGGDLEAENRPDGGALFRLRIPRAVPPDLPSAPRPL